LRLFLLSLALLCAFPSKAQQQDSQSGTNQQAANNTSPYWLRQTNLTGDWGGKRTKLQEAGVTLRAHFITETAANPTGGQRQTIRYTQQVDFRADLDLDRLVGLSDAKIQITLTDRAGRSLSADAIGNQFAVQELYGAGQNFRLSEFEYEQDFFTQKVNIGFGWAPVGDNFATISVLCDFQNAVLCGHTNAMTVNSGAHNFPTGEWGAHVKIIPVPQFYVATGVYQVNPDEDNGDNGFNLSFHSTGVFVPVELGWLPGQSPGGLPGTYKIGAYYNSSPTPDVLTDVKGAFRRPNRRAICDSQWPMGYLRNGGSDGLPTRT
jgi:porin